MLNRVRKFRDANDGIAAVEFALIAPLLIAMFFASVELTTALDCNARVARVASTASDLVSRVKTVSTADVSNVFAASNAILYPHSATNVKIVISSLIDNGSGGAKVAWSEAQNTTARAKDATLTVPDGVIKSGSGGSVIFAEVTYDYSSPVAFFLGKTVTLSSTFYSRPRRSTIVVHS